MPTHDAGVFTAGALPADEESFRSYLQGAAAEVEKWTVGASAALHQVAAAMVSALDGGALTKAELSTAVSRAVPAQLTPWCRSCEVRHVPDPLFRAAGMLGVVVFAAGEDDSRLARTDRWLGRPLPDIDPDQARAELVRRYLHCYGPSTPARFAEWTLLSRGDARRAFELIGDELVEVRAAGKRASVLADDEKALSAPPEASGVRLLPPHDPYLQQRDRDTLLPDKAQRSAVWRPIGGPGVVLVDGCLVGTWRSRKKSTTLAVTVQPFTAIARQALAGIEAEAAAIAGLRGAGSAEVMVEP